jgi:formylglycine-generating enzyme required for sulfatase activity
MKALPDTLTWYNLEWVSDSLVNVFAQYYFRHPAYNNYPIVGISYEQAIEFCKWRTMVANQFSYFKEKGITNWKSYTDDKFPLRYIYRLPTKKEWETIATAGVDSTKKTLKRFSKKYSFSYNSKELFYSSRKFEHGRMFIPDPPTTNVRSFYLSKLGTYNMTGNVAEMVLEKGIAKGGSFIHPLASCKNDVDQYYPEPIYWLGFRCVAVVVK